MGYIRQSAHHVEALAGLISQDVICNLLHTPHKGSGPWCQLPGHVHGTCGHVGNKRRCSSAGGQAGETESLAARHKKPCAEFQRQQGGLGKLNELRLSRTPLL